MGRLTSLFSPLAELQREMDRMFEAPFAGALAPPRFTAGVGNARAGAPALNVWEDEGSAYVEAELPGLTLEDVEVLAADGELTIGGRRKAAEPQGATCHRRERPAGQFRRTVTLPWEIDAAKVEARLSDGVLTIKLPKAESAKPRKVAVLPA